MGKQKNEGKRKSGHNIRVGAVLWFLLGILCLLYGISVLAAGSGTAFFAVWLAMGICCWIFALAVWLRLWKKLPRAAKRMLLCLVVVGAGFFCVVEGFIFSGFHAKEEEGLDYLIVLGAQVYERGPSPVLAYRLDAAVRYLSENPDTVCIVSGGQGANEPFSEAQGMADYLIANGIEKERILLEDQSRSTVENIVNSMEFFDAETETVGIVTNNFHVFRATGIAKKQGIVNVCGICADANLWYLPNNLLREFFGVCKDTLVGNMSW